MITIKKGYIREGAGAKQAVIKTLKVGQTLTVVRRVINSGGGKWYEVEDKGYINVNRVKDV